MYAESVQSPACEAVLRIRDILVRIRIPRIGASDLWIRILLFSSKTFKCTLRSPACEEVLRIRDILVLIRILRIRASDLWIRILLFSRRQQKTSAYYIMKVHLHHFSKIKKLQRSHQMVGIKAFLTIFA
jgi:hypothetical protein